MPEYDLKYGVQVYEQQYSLEELNTKPYYNLGAGGFYHPMWTNIDYQSDWYDDCQKNPFINHDLRSNEPIPVSSDSAIACYTSHVVEHLEECFVLQMFKEANRMLRKGGVFRVQTAPDAETDYRAMMNGDVNWFWWDKKHYSQPGSYEHIFYSPADSVPIEERWLYNVASQLAPNAKAESDVKYSAPQIRAIIKEFGFERSLDFFTSQCRYDPQRPGNHMSWWTHEKVINLLKVAGFETVYRSGYRQSVLSILRNTAVFDNSYPEMSIYVEAIK